MNSNTNLKGGELDKALDMLSSHRRNYKQKIHDEARDYIANNLGLIKDNLTLLEKELRVVGGSVDIVAKDEKFFYFIEVKTRLSNRAGVRGLYAKQLLDQEKGLKYTISLFVNQELPIKLILVEYIRDIKKMLIYSVGDGGVNLIKEV